MVEGYVKAHDRYVKMCDLEEAQGRVVVTKDAGTKDKVGVVIGGGSGHEPLFIGYVGVTDLASSSRQMPPMVRMLGFSCFSSVQGSAGY